MPNLRRSVARSNMQRGACKHLPKCSEECNTQCAGPPPGIKIDGGCFIIQNINRRHGQRVSHSFLKASGLYEPGDGYPRTKMIRYASSTMRDVPAKHLYIGGAAWERKFGLNLAGGEEIGRASCRA